MARILPDEIDAAAHRGQAAREIETLERLERELPDEYTVFHGVHWAHADAGAAFYGEIDFVVANRMDERAERVNITLPRRVLARLDAKARAAGETRSGYIARLALSAP